MVCDGRGIGRNQEGNPFFSKYPLEGIKRLDYGDFVKVAFGGGGGGVLPPRRRPPLATQKENISRWELYLMFHPLSTLRDTYSIQITVCHQRRILRATDAPPATQRTTRTHTQH